MVFLILAALVLFCLALVATLVFTITHVHA